MSMIARVLVLCSLAAFVASMALAEDFTTFESKKFGYSLKIPKEFKMNAKEDKTTAWSFQPGSTPAADKAGGEAKEEKGAKKGIGGLAKGVAGALTGGKVKTEAPAAPEQKLEPALTISVNWVWMPDVASGTLFDTNKKSDLENIKSPAPDYKDLVVMDKKSGYAIEAPAYWYKEVDKSDPAEIHRWHIKAFGNKSFYTIGLTGTYKQFEKWGPIYEQVIKSFKLIPLEGNK